MTLPLVRSPNLGYGEMQRLQDWMPQGAIYALAR
jgi:hypothetical protein